MNSDVSRKSFPYGFFLTFITVAHRYLNAQVWVSSVNSDHYGEKCLDTMLVCGVNEQIN
jgi:hypothetical protein